MSAKDLCTLPFIEKLKKSGIVSFKIEGRNRSPEYVRTVVSVYRTALDKKLNNKEIEKLVEKLKTVYHRDMSSGFYLGLPTSDDFSKSNFGESTEHKMFIGKIMKYWPKSETVAIKLNAGTLKLKDEVYIIGNTTGIKRVKIESIERHNKNIKTATKGMTVGIKSPKCKKGDDVYIIK
jgi:putative protease